MLRESVALGIEQVGRALREPEEFAARWRRGDARYGWFVWTGLIATSILGTATYGMTMGLLGDWQRILLSAVRLTLGAGLAWGLPLPALYIFNSLGGSRLDPGSTFLAAIVTTSWGGLAMIASVPINWFLTVAVPESTFVLAVNGIVFTGVGVAMTDVFRRVMTTLEPSRGSAPTWILGLVAVIGSELFYAFHLFDFATH